MDYGEILQDFPCNTFISIFRSPCVVICGGEGRRQGMLQVSKQAKTLAVEKFLCFFFLYLFFSRRYWHSSKHRGPRWSGNTTKTWGKGGWGWERCRGSVKEQA